MVIINQSGDFVIPPEFDGGVAAGVFVCGLARVQKDGRWGFIEKSGRFVIPPQFDMAYDFSEGMAVVRIAGEEGFINTAGDLVIRPRFSSVHSFSEGRAPAQIGEMDPWGFLSVAGDFVIEPTFTMVRAFRKGLSLVETQDTLGYIDQQGNYVWQGPWTEPDPLDLT